MWAAIAFAVRPSKDICHETDAPVSDLVTVAENVPLASDTAPLGDGTSWAAFITVRIWMSVACGLADAPTVATSAPASARAGMTARVLMNPSFRASVTPLWRGTTRVPVWRIDAAATRGRASRPQAPQREGLAAAVLRLPVRQPWVSHLLETRLPVARPPRVATVSAASTSSQSVLGSPTRSAVMPIAGGPTMKPV